MTLSAPSPAALDAGRIVRSAGQRLALARVAAVGLATVVVGSLFLPQWLGQERLGDVVGFAGMAAAAVWVLLGFNAARQGRRVREAAALATLGRSDLAEARAMATLETFCLLRPVTVGAAAVLARVRQTQGRHVEAARLAEFVLSRRERTLTGGKRAVRLLLAEALVAAGEHARASRAVMPLYESPLKPGDRLDLDEALRLLSLQIRLDAALDRWDALHAGIDRSMPMVELMPIPTQVEATRTLLEAANRSNDQAWSAFLSRRVRLLAEEAA